MIKNIMQNKIDDDKYKILLRNLPLEMNRYIFDYIPSLHCSKCYKKLINYNICYIHYFIKIRNMTFCSYYCAIKFKYNEYIFLVQWHFLLLVLKVNLFIGYLFLGGYILLHMLIILLFNIVKVFILYTF